MNWISVKERLPEQGVLVDVKLGKVRCVEKLKLVGSRWVTPNGYPYIWTRPTHWSQAESLCKL